jgi:hypothetical protein
MILTHPQLSPLHKTPYGTHKRGTLKIESGSRKYFRQNFLIQGIIGIIGSSADFHADGCEILGQRYSFDQGSFSYLAEKENNHVLFIGFV